MMERIQPRTSAVLRYNASSETPVVSLISLAMGEHVILRAAMKQRGKGIRFGQPGVDHLDRSRSGRYIVLGS